MDKEEELVCPDGVAMENLCFAGVAVKDNEKVLGVIRMHRETIQRHASLDVNSERDLLG